MVQSNFWITPKDLFASDLHLLHVLQQGLKETGVHYFREKVPQSPTHCFRPEQCVWNAYPIQRTSHILINFSPTSPRPTTVNILHIALHVNDTIFLKITLLRWKCMSQMQTRVATQVSELQKQDNQLGAMLQVSLVASCKFQAIVNGNFNLTNTLIHYEFYWYDN